MAKTEPKTTPASDPTIAPPPIVITPDEVPTEPEIAIDIPSTLPVGVQMHNTGQLPNTTDRAARIARDPKSPPIGWKGSFRSCGSCGDFLGNADHCPTCAPGRVLPNVFNQGGV